MGEQKKKKGVAICVKNDAGEILLLRRGPKSRYEPGKWEQCGGQLEPGENFEEAAVREVREELGCEVKLGKTLLHEEFSDMGDGVVWEMKVIEGRLKGKPVIQEPEKCVELKWVKQEDLSEMDLCTHAREDYERLGWLE